MLQTLSAKRGMVTAPHHLAAQTGLAVLRDGGNAVEAVVAAAAAIAVVYPHMNGIGGDGFWLIAGGRKHPIGIEACGAAAHHASIGFYNENGMDRIPARGPFAASTVAGTVSGWAKALEIASGWGKPLPLSRLLADAITYAQDGVPLTAAHCETLAHTAGELHGVAGFEGLFLRNGLPKSGALFANDALGATLARLSEAGLDDFYRGDVATSIATDLAACGSPLRLADLQAHSAQTIAPLSVRLRAGEIFNLPPPTQGLASLSILALYSRIAAAHADGFDHIHRIVECTKAAFKARDLACADPRSTLHRAGDFLQADVIEREASKIDTWKATPWPIAPEKGDTVWIGAIDNEGRAVSFIQSIYWEFGSGIVLPSTGINWQNRSMSFSLDPRSPNALLPGRKPFHTLNPALARLPDGRTMVYGAMGGDGQPQTQAAVFSRYAMYGQALQTAVSAPRWLLGRGWGSPSAALKLEARIPPEVAAALAAAGHEVEIVDAFSSIMGHAGAIARSGDGVLYGAADPRSDGAVAAF